MAETEMGEGEKLKADEKGWECGTCGLYPCVCSYRERLKGEMGKPEVGKIEFSDHNGSAYESRNDNAHRPLVATSAFSNPTLGVQEKMLAALERIEAAIKAQRKCYLCDVSLGNDVRNGT